LLAGSINRKLYNPKPLRRDKLKTILRIAAFTLFAALGWATAFADGHIMVDDPYVRAVPPGQPNSAAFMTIMNKGENPVALVSASSSAAGVVELHTHVHEDGMMKMRRIEKIDVPAGGSTALEPGGLHVMLIGLTQDLKPEDKVAITLEFSDGSTQELEAPVRKIMMQMKSGGGMQHNH
jgi:copper(I)-binding protein